MKKFYFLLTFMLLTLGIGNAWGETVTLNDIGANLSSTSNTKVATTTVGDYTLNYLQGKKQGNAILLAKGTDGGTSFISNKTPIPGAINSITVYINSGAAGKATYHCAFSTTECTSRYVEGSTAVNITGGNSNKYTCSVANANYFCIALGNNNNGQVLKLDIEYTPTSAGGEPEPVIVKTLKSIAVTGQQITYEQGDMFKFNGTCIATYSVTKDDVAQADETKEVTPTSVSTPDMNTIGDKVVSVSYTENEVTVETTYTITVTENTITAGEYCITPNNTFWGTSFSGSLSGDALDQTYTGKQDDITIKYSKGSASNLYINDSQCRTYDGTVMTFSVPTGYVITAIAFTANGTNWAGTHSASVGTMTDNKNWSGSAPEVTFTFGGKCQITNICVTYAEAGETPEPVMFTVTATAENGTVEGAGEYEHGTEVTLTATPADGYEFVNWTSGETEVSTANPFTFTVTSDTTLVANFKELVIETVYFVNAQDWPGTITAHAWGGSAAGTEWPGLATVKEADQIGGKDVYSFTAEAGAYAKVIFNNGSGKQTTDLIWTAGKYYVVDGWYTKEEAQAKLATPIPDSWTVAGAPASVFGSNWITTDTNNDMVKQADGTYKWEKTGLELVANSTISFKVVKNHAWDEVYPGENYDLSISENGIYTITITFDPSAKTVNAVATKTSDAEIEATISYVLMGVADDWITGIALTANPENANEYILLGQTISEGDAVKVVTLTNDEQTAWCGNVDEYSAVEHSFDGDGNIVLAPGKYDFYFKVNENLIFIAAVEPEVIEYVLNGGELPAVVVPTQDSLIAAFKDGYNAYFGVSVATTRDITNFLYAGTQLDPKCDVSLFMTDDASPWKWLGDYVLAVTNAQVEAGLLVNLKGLATELMWRQSLTGFFLQQAKLDSNYKGNADFTEAGKPEAWSAAYEAAHAVVLPTAPVDAPYALPTPVKDGCTFVGWYDNAEGTGEAYTVIPAGWSGTLYAIWKQGTATDLENIAVEGKAVKAIVNGQLIIIKNGVQYNAQGAVVK